MPSGMLPRSINSPSASRRTPVARGVVKVGASMCDVDASPKEIRTEERTGPRRSLLEGRDPLLPLPAFNFQKARTLHLAIRVMTLFCNPSASLRNSAGYAIECCNKSYLALVTRWPSFDFCSLADGDSAGSFSLLV